MAMTGEACFGIWAPDRSPWSAWAKPVLFAQAQEMPEVTAADAPAAPPLPELWTADAVVVDLPGAEAVAAGLAIAASGFQPVPLFNGTSGPNPMVDVEPIRRALVHGAQVIGRSTIAADARPAFLLDARRMARSQSVGPGRYDNRWIVLPQDCPSGIFMRAHGVSTVALVQRGAVVAEDLAHVLRRWQDAGILLSLVDLDAGSVPKSLTVPRPSWFRLLWYSAIAVAGLRRSNVGGFGAQIPLRTGRSGFYG